MKISKLIAFIVILMLTGCSRSAEKPYVAVITKSTESSFWKSVYSGVSTAANEYNINFTFEGPSDEENYEAQNQMIEQAILNNADAIVFSAISYNGSSEKIEKAADKGIKIVVVDSDVNSDRVSVRIGTDNYGAGKAAAAALLDSLSGSLKLGIVNYDVNSENGQMREKGFTDVMAESDRAEIAETINVQSNIPSSMTGTRAMLLRNPDIRGIVTFNEWTSLGVGYCIREMGLSDTVLTVGFDNHTDLVGMLESGAIDRLIVQNPFAIGYLGIKNACMLLDGKRTDSRITTQTTVVTRENMYTPDIQKILFPVNE